LLIGIIYGTAIGLTTLIRNGKVLPIHPSSIPYGALVAVGSIWLDDQLKILGEK
jgi:hypothetical protein